MTPELKKSLFEKIKSGERMFLNIGILYLDVILRTDQFLKI